MFALLGNVLAGMLTPFLGMFPTTGPLADAAATVNTFTPPSWLDYGPLWGPIQHFVDLRVLVVAVYLSLSWKAGWFVVRVYRIILELIPMLG